MRCATALGKLEETLHQIQQLKRELKQTMGRYDCGQTDDLDRRVRQHNDPDYHHSRTAKVFLPACGLLTFQERCQ